MKCVRQLTTTFNTGVFRSISNRKYTGTIMGSDPCKKHLQCISKHLTEFENKPKIIDGNMITEWFNVGEKLFKEFYDLGIAVKWYPSEVKKKQTEVDVIISQISKNQGWLQSFITIYPGLRIDLEGCNPAVNICRVRSGIEFLLVGFANINKNFDKVLDNLKEMGELEEFDDHLKVWKESHRPDFFAGDFHKDTPKAHWWWF